MNWHQVLVNLLGRLPPGVILRIRAWQGSSPFLRRIVKWGAGFLKNRVVTIAQGAGSGLVFNTGNSNIEYSLGISEPLVQEALTRYLTPGAVFYDIGANVGFFSLIGARLVGQTGQVYAFEPLPENAAMLRRNIELNHFSHVTVFEKAVAASPGKGLLLLPGKPTEVRLVVDGIAPEDMRTIPVELVSIDDLLDLQLLVPPAAVKIDVEGGEIDVLQGMIRTITRHKPVIICEMHGKNRAFGSLIRSLDYDITTLDEAQPVEEASWWVHVVACPIRRLAGN